MVIVVHLDAASLARVRFAMSPASEAATWLRLTATGNRHAVFGDPGPAARFALRDPDVALLGRVFVAGGRYMPDLLTPKPVAGPANRAWDSQLEAVRETPLETVVTQLRRCPGTVDESDAFSQRAARGLSVFWKHAIAEAWPELRGRLQADLTAKARTMATNGIGAVLGSLHSSVAWAGSALRVCKRWDEELRYTGDELVLAPTVLAWPAVWAQLCDPRNALLCYPANGAGGAAATSEREALGKLLGPTRATLLRDLDVPRSTTDLSARHQLAPATVSYHLQVLHGSGLVTRLRERRLVLYRRTEQGDALHG